MDEVTGNYVPIFDKETVSAFAQSGANCEFDLWFYISRPG